MKPNNLESSPGFKDMECSKKTKAEACVLVGCTPMEHTCGPQLGHGLQSVSIGKLQIPLNQFSHLQSGYSNIFLVIFLCC